MTYREFRVPDAEEVEVALLTRPRAGEEVGVQHLALRSNDGFDVAITTDVLGRSVHVAVRRGTDEFLTIEREGAVELLVSAIPPEIVATFRTDDSTGRLAVALAPQLKIEEFSLLT